MIALVVSPAIRVISIAPSAVENGVPAGAENVYDPLVPPEYLRVNEPEFASTITLLQFTVDHETGIVSPDAIVVFAGVAKDVIVQVVGGGGRGVKLFTRAIFFLSTPLYEVKYPPITIFPSD